MKPVRRVADHALRLSRQFGQPLSLGDRKYRIKGYISNQLALDSGHEEQFLEVFRRLLERDGHFVDVGVNRGQTLGKVLTLDPSRDYIGFEPQVAACSMVARFIRDNGLTNCRVLPLGLSDEGGLLSFYAAGEADEMGSLLDVGKTNAVETVVPVMTGDEVLAALGVEDVAVIKIDVEGAELAVIRGFRNTLETLRPPVIFEVLPNVARAGGPALTQDEARQRQAQADEIHDFLAGLGYRIFRIDGAGEELAVDRIDLDIVEGFVGGDYVARPA